MTPNPEPPPAPRPTARPARRSVSSRGRHEVDDRAPGYEWPANWDHGWVDDDTDPGVVHPPAAPDPVVGDVTALPDSDTGHLTAEEFAVLSGTEQAAAQARDNARHAQTTVDIPPDATDTDTQDDAGQDGDVTPDDTGSRVVNHATPGAYVGHQSSGRVDGVTVIVGDLTPDGITAIQQQAARLRHAAANTAGGDVTASHTGDVIGIQAREIHNSRVHTIPADPAADSTKGT